MSNQFKYPILEDERGEFERVSKELHIPLQDLLDAAEYGTMIELDESIWLQLENTDSNDIQKGDWDKVDTLCKQKEREWREYKQDLEAGKSISAPTIVKFGERYHKVAGDTRLMVCRAMGITPRVLLFEVAE